MSGAYELVDDLGADGVVVLPKRGRTVVGKVLGVKTKRTKTYRYRWIVRERDDGRLVVRTPKFGTLMRDLDRKRPGDYGKEHLLPLGALISYWPKPRRRRKATKQ